VRPKTVLRYAGRSLAFTPATLITPTFGTLIAPSRSTTALTSTSILAPGADLDLVPRPDA